MGFFKNLHPLLKRERNNHRNDDNYAIFNAINSLLEESEQETKENKLQSSLNSANNEYLDYWGDWFGVYRYDKEYDEDFRKRIIARINVPRGTNASIAWAILNNYYKDMTIGIQVDETWRRVFTYNNSLLNGDHKFLGSYYNIAVLEIRLGEPFDNGIREVIDNFKPAGVTYQLIYDPSLGRTEGFIWDIDGRRNPFANLEISNQFLQGLNLIPYGYTTLPIHHREVSQDKGLIKSYSGEITFGDRIIGDNNDLFIINDSNLNSRDILSGSYHITNKNLNLASYGSKSYKPTEKDYLGHILHNLGDIADSREVILKEGTNTLEIYLNPGTAFFGSFGIGSHLRAKEYTYVTDSKHLVELLNTLTLTINSKENKSGVNLNIQLFNFIKNEWDTFYNYISSPNYSSKRASFPKDMTPYINKQELLQFRIVSPIHVIIELDNLFLDYNKKSDSITKANIGYKARSNPNIIEGGN